MKRLIDERFDPDSPEHRLADLVRAAPIVEYKPFDRPVDLARAARPVAPTRIFASPAGLVLVLGGAAFAAAAGHFALGSRHPGALGVAPPAAHVSVEAAATDVSLTATDEAPALPPMPSETPPPSHSSAAMRTGGGAPKSGEDPSLVIGALRMLRNGGDAGRASALLATYLRGHPRGVLAEDALALSIEAAVARRDSRAASELAHRYEAQYPAGRFRSFAHQVLANSP